MATPFYVENLRIEQVLGEKALFISWQYPGGALPSAHLLMLVRRQKSYPENVQDGELVFGTEVNTSFKDTDLTAGNYYYYTAFIRNNETAPEYYFSPLTQAHALVLKDYNHSKTLWESLPEKMRVDDESGDLERLLSVWGKQFDSFKTEIQAFSHIRTGANGNPNALNALTQMLGIPEIGGMPIDVLRRAALHLIYVYKRKGTVPGITEAVKIFTNWETYIKEARTSIFKTWDGQSKSDQGQIYASTPGLFISSLQSDWQPNQWQNALLIDSKRKRFLVTGNIGNSSPTVTVKAGTPSFQPQTTGHSTLIGPGFLMDSTQTFITNKFSKLILIDQNGSYQRIKSNSDDTLFFTDAFVNVAPGKYTILSDYTIQSGDHTTLYHNGDLATLKGTEYDPFSTLFSSVITDTQLNLLDTDILITVKDVSPASGISTGVATSILTNSFANWEIDAFKGMKLNPNLIQNQELSIVSNTKTTITVAESNLNVIASKGSRYAVLSKADTLKLDRLTKVMPNFVAAFAKPVIFFEPTEFNL